MRKISEKGDYPPIIFVYQGDLKEGETFFSKLWPEARAVSDMEKRFYTAFGLERGGIKEMFSSEVWACGARAAAKGHMIGVPVGDPWMMPGLFLFERDQLIWQHDFAHAGDHPDWESVPIKFEKVGG